MHYVARSLTPILLLALGACGTRAAPVTAEVPGAMTYHLTFDAGLRTVEVRADFGATAPARIRIQDESVVTRAIAQPSGTQLEWVDGRATLPPGTITLTYGIDLGRARRRDAQIDTDGILVDPSLLLARPSGGPARHLRARVHVPDGHHVAVPWAPTKNGYRIPRSTFQMRGWMAVGTFTPIVCRVGETEIVCAPMGPLRASPEELARCLRDAAAVALPLAAEHAPRRVLVILRPTPRSTDAIAFGETLYGGGATLSLLVGANAPGSAFAGEWVTVHEMSHLALPRVRRADAWFSEGLATYFQNVLRSRAEMLEEQEAWAEFVAGAARGRRGAERNRTSLYDESAQMGARHAFMRVYWSGAAIALLWDVALRRDHGRTLDDALRHAAAEFPPSGEPVAAARVMARMDAWVGEPLFTRIAERWLAESAFPDVAPTLAWLGVSDPLDGSAPGADVRRAISSAIAR